MASGITGFQRVSLTQMRQVVKKLNSGSNYLCEGIWGTPEKRAIAIAAPKT